MADDFKDKIRTTTYLPESLYERLRLESFETKESQALIVERALEQYFQALDKEKPGE